MLLALVSSACAGEGPKAVRGAGTRPWNVVILSVDTLRADHLGAYGYDKRPTSPHVDALLASGVRFERAMAPRAATWPSLTSMLTGLFPISHGVLENGYRIPKRIPTLPKRLAPAGYRTGAFLANMCKANHKGWEQLSCGDDRGVTERALGWAGRLGPDRPFLLWVHYMGGHDPYAKGVEAARKFDPSYEGPFRPRGKSLARDQLDRVMIEGRRLGPRDIAYVNALYDGAIRATDELIGMLLDGLRAQGRLERTLVVFLGDHGEELYEHHDYLYHACSVYQTALRVPLGFIAPGRLPAGAVVRRAVEVVDILPTILDLLDLPAPAERHGVSLRPQLERPPEGETPHPVFSDYGTNPIRTVLMGKWTLIVNPERESPECLEGAKAGFYPIQQVELYDLEADPGETRNLASREPTRVADLQALIRARFAGLERRGEKQEIPEDVQRELRALGYVAN